MQVSKVGTRLSSRVSPSRRASTLEVDFSPQSVSLSPRHAQESKVRTRMGRTHLSTDQQHYQQQYEDFKQALTEHVRDTFKRKECIHFVPDPKKIQKSNPVVCHCGESAHNHIKGTNGISEFYTQGMEWKENDLNDQMKWSLQDDVRKFPTDAFGKIDFVHEGLGGRKPSKYLRVSDDTPVDDVITFMKDYWRMNNPQKANLVITVIGGAKNFKLDGKKKEIFNRGLVDAAQTTHAWIITSGCNMGVMKAVGEAVAEGQTYNWDEHGMTHTLRCIGIAPWGYVERRQTLVTKDGQGSWNASYKVNNTIRHGQPVSLNHNHTHFLLVDDGMRHRYGGVAEFRAKLERKLSLPTKPGDNGAKGQEVGEGVPVVLVVVEGGYDAIDDVSRSLKQNIPVVICEGTGRAADILAYAYARFVTTRKGDRKMRARHQNILEDKLCAAFGKTWAARSDERKEAARYTQLVMDCCTDEKLITVFDMNKNEDLDLAILSALLKGQGAVNVHQLRDQLKLALTWNRSDVAEEKIFNMDINYWEPGFLDDIMTEALVDDKVSFVRLLLQNGLVMKEYLTVNRLVYLYNAAPKMSHLRQLLQQQTSSHKFTLRDVAKILRKLIGKHNNEMYYTDEGEVGEETPACFSEPFRELFLWAVLMNRQEMAKFVWERGDEAIPCALVASTIYRSLAHLVAHYDSDLKESYLSHKQEFELLGVKVLEECHNTDPEKATLLIERTNTTWGEMNCLEMAATAEDREFLSTVCCQNLLDMMWNKGVSSHWGMVLLAIFCPFLILTKVRFHDDDGPNRMSATKKLLTFYRAPVTKFSANLLFYVLFLLLYCYMLLFSFRRTVTSIEWIVIFWISTLLIEELREMFFSSKADSILTRIKDWWQFSLFNRIDLAILILALLGFILRMLPADQYFIASKTVYAINCVFFFVRVLRDYSASSYLGPKLVMVARMLEELILYIMILVVFLLAYGVSSLALMFPIRDFYPLVFRDIFYFPYWQLYGELYLEELEGTTSDCLGNSTVRENGQLCPQFSWLVPVLTAAYLLIGNLLLLNILIAIFNHVFDEIQTNSIQIWKHGLYFLVVEYDQKPGVAPPFIILEHATLLINALVTKLCCPKKDKGQHLNKKHIEMLAIFEKEMLRSYLVRQERQSGDNLTSYVARIHHRVEEMSKMMEDERILEQQHFEAEQNRLASGLVDNIEVAPERPTLHSRRSRITMPIIKDEFPGRSLEHTDSVASLDVGALSMTPDQPSRPSSRKMGSSRPKFSRWPSLHTVLTLKNRLILESIDEQRSLHVDSQSDTDNCAAGRTKTPASEFTPGMTTESDVDYDRLNFQRLRPAPDDPTYDKIGKTLDVLKRPVIPDEQPSQYKLRRRKSKKERERHSQIAPTPSEVELERVTAALESANQRLVDLESKVEQMEENSRVSLYNIEALLRNAVFSRTAPQTHTGRQHRRRPYGSDPYNDDLL